MFSSPLQAVIDRIADSITDDAAASQFHSLADELADAVGMDVSDDLIPALSAVIGHMRGMKDGAGRTSDSLQELAARLRALGVTVPPPPVPAAQDAMDDAILFGFLDDRRDSLDELEDLALALESADSPEMLDSIMRIVHSIKGDAGVLSMDDISQTCHDLEDEIGLLQHDAAARLTLAAVKKLRARFSELSGEAPVELEATPVEEEGEPLEPDDISEIDKELAGEFVAEAREHLETVDSSLLILESGQTEEHEEAVNTVFRAFHTIKGLAGFLHLEIMMSLAHEAEAMLERVRAEEVTLSAQIVNAAFEVNDGLKTLISSLESALHTGGAVPAPPGYSALVKSLKNAASGVGAVPVGSQSAEAARPGSPTPKAEASTRSEKSASSQQVGGTIKVDASRLDLLIDTIGELVIAESMVTQCAQVDLEKTSRLPALLGQLDKTTRELQEMAMSLRMVPIRATFRRMARLARDVSHRLGKPIDFVTQGDDTELDKTVVDVIGDPLVHMVRNAIDHGIEDSSRDREAAGKPPTGRIVLRAFHEGGSIHVEIEDDGGGLDRDMILGKARRKGIIGDETDAMSDAEVFGLIFAPGFSTADAVTEVSGRGVGLDVVKRNIESLRGRVEIRSELGKGTLFSIRLPLTLAIIDGMVVRVCDRRYIVPTLSIIRMFRPTDGQITKVLDTEQLLRVGDELVPLTRMDDLFELERSGADIDSMSAIVVESGRGNFAFLVDELMGQQQIVIKPLGETVSEVEGFAGGAIMPDGTVGLIIDIAGLVNIVTTPVQAAHLELQEAS